jgi:hypothetical protein
MNVYSIVDNVVRVSLIDMTSPLFEVDILSKLIKLELATKSNEPLMSVRNHEQRANFCLFSQKEYCPNLIRINEWVPIKNLDELLDSVVYEKNDFIELGNSPYTPLKCIAHAITRKLLHKTVRISRESVNFVLLDDEPEMKCSNLIVANKVETTDDGKIKLRNTCLFPKIKGLVSLCLLIFAPTAELR